MSYNLVDPTTGDLTRVAGGIDTSIIPSNASASNKLVTHQVPYELFTLNNNSGSQKWYKLGKYEEGNYTARLDFVSARVDGQMFESSVRISGIGIDNNYVSWVGEKGCEISTIAVKVDSARNLYIKMNSYSAVEIRVYGTFTLDIVEQSSEPSGVQIVLNVLATMDNLPTTGVGTGINKQDIVSGDANTTINIPAYHFCSGFMYLQINGIGTALLSYDTDFDRNLHLNVLAGAGMSLTGLALYKGTIPLGTFSVSGDYIVFTAQYSTVIRTNYTSL